MLILKKNSDFLVPISPEAQVFFSHEQVFKNMINTDHFSHVESNYQSLYH